MKFITRIGIIVLTSVLVQMGLQHLGVGFGSQMVMAAAIGFFGDRLLPKADIK